MSMPVNVPESQQIFRTLADIRQQAFSNDRAATDYFQLKRDHDNLLAAFNSLLQMIADGDFSPLSGTGSPEGVIPANYSLLYIDTAGPTLYYNSTFEADTGWVAL